jgi:hypothetical protein
MQTSSSAQTILNKKKRFTERKPDLEDTVKRLTKTLALFTKNEGGKYFSVSLLTISCNIKKRCKLAIIRLYVYE